MSKPMARKRSATKSAERSVRKRRSIGRPPAGQQTVGRDALIARTCQMMMQMPANKITRAEVARHMNVDPSLIRYYFRDRTTLLLAAAEKLTDEFMQMLEQEHSHADTTAVGRLRARVSTLLNLNVAYPFFHRLLMDELVNIDSPSAKRFLENLVKRGFNGYSSILDSGIRDGVFKRVNPAFLFLAIIGMCEFLVSGIPILRIALGKDLDERGISTRYRDFICDLLIEGLKTR